MSDTANTQAMSEDVYEQLCGFHPEEYCIGLLKTAFDSFENKIEQLQRELVLYKSLAICECGEQAEYPAHGWMPNLCPACQAEAIK